jgi:hypothetical protein
VGDPLFSRFEVLRVMSLRIQVFCDVTLWQWVTGSWCYEGIYRGADKSLARPTSRCILFDGENILFDASLVFYIYIVLIFLQLSL